MKDTLNKIGNYIHNKIMGFGLKFHEFLKSGGWIEIIAVGAFGILCASAGMIHILFYGSCRCYRLGNIGVCCMGNCKID